MPRRPIDRLRAILFDWDGTLVESAEATFRCYVRVFGSFGIRFDREAFDATYSPDWYRTYSALGIPEVDWPEADARWMECYMTESVTLVHGARSALDRVREQGLGRALVTSGSRERILRDLEELKLQGFFGTLVCAEDSKRRKPAPDALLRALDRLGVSAEDAVYLGDSPEDVEMARAAGVFSVGIPGGFPNRGELAGADADLSATDLNTALDVLLRGESAGGRHEI